VAANLGPVTERRRSPRTTSAAVHGISQARVRPGHEASVIDISADGARIETPLRLLPGRHVELHLERGDQLTAVRARVLRCHVTRVLPSRVSYCAVVGFDQPLTWLTHSNEYQVLAGTAGDRGTP
jgi:PilZ domain-containing protein